MYWTYSFIQSCYGIATLGIFIAAGLVHLVPSLPSTLRDLVVYGKSRHSMRNKLLWWLEVPKRYFSHFYILACFSSAVAFLLAWQRYFLRIKCASILSGGLGVISRPQQFTNSECASFLTILLFLFHSFRRMFESLFVSVYSDSNMNVIHYLMGMGHYILVPLALLSESPGFVQRNSKVSTPSISDLTWPQLFGTVLFVWACYRQHMAVRVLARMRRSHTGNVTNYAHAIPVGDWFGLVSCPHFLAEILIYVALYFTLELASPTWLFVLGFVATNQVLAALITHRWYVVKFGTMYPSDRKALIPYVF